MHKFSNLFLEYNSTCFRQVFCPKHVEFYSKNKFEKFLNLVGFITRIYHDARSSECQKVPVTLSHFCTKNLMWGWPLRLKYVATFSAIILTFKYK